MKFKINEELHEDFEVAPGITFNQLMDAAMNGDGDFVLNPPKIDGEINLPEDKWNKLYDIMFNTNEDTLYTSDDEYDLEKNQIHQFGRRYNCV